VHRRDQRVWIDRLSENAQIVGLDEIARIACHDDDRNVAHSYIPGDFLLHVATVQARQREIQDDECRRFNFEATEGIYSVDRLRDVEARDHQR